ncbi:hypothetical protein GDI1080 [Gluconacetobacter diazotrophicus PA1 5]|uniref:Uncharacterized protein n=1 Tax=Gluconacetobacter diazotrophicus (strain ATCC 49037 / DSM 5601 / CCUG 37298 / CIP 103539 / LMG 7603 / PAl5) TaxID=272568 RepID=A9HD02_GLUDA|nr:hypothetical protein GDI1080 [Gluconacetobacter diazotrophicus PA1 5]
MQVDDVPSVAVRLDEGHEIPTELAQDSILVLADKRDDITQGGHGHWPDVSGID